MRIDRCKRFLGWRPASLVLAGLASATPCSASLLVDLDASQLPPGPLNSWTNSGIIGDSFIVPTNATAPSIASVDGVNAVMFLKTGAAAGTHYFGPEVPAALTGAGIRTVEAWVHNPTPQPEETIVAWGRRADSANINRNFAFGEGTDNVWGALFAWGNADVGWNTNEVFGRWTHLAITFDGTTIRVYSDGQLANSKTRTLDTAAFATTDLFSYIDSTNRLHFRIARQNTLMGDVDSSGAGAFGLGHLKIYDEAFDSAAILQHFNTEKGSFNLNDSDGDGIPDWYEARCGLNIVVNDAALDKDSDGLSNAKEFQLGTRADQPDTDGDGVSDGAEVNRIDPQTGALSPTNPLNADTDADGLLDGVETDTGVFLCGDDSGSDPTKVDTDGDGDPDSTEAHNSTDPSDPASFCHCIVEFGPPPCLPVRLDAANLSPGSLNIWTNKGTVGGTFNVPTNATPPTVTFVDRLKSVRFSDLGGAAGGTHLIGPEVSEFNFAPFFPYGMLGNGSRTVEAWVHDVSPLAQKTIFAWGRAGGATPPGQNFALGHGTDSIYGALDAGGIGDLGGGGQEVFGRWTCITIVCSKISVSEGTNSYDTNIVSAYVDGQLVSTQTNAINTATYAADAPGSANNSTNKLHFRIARQNTDVGEPADVGIGAFDLAQVRVFNRALNSSNVLRRFNAQRLLFQPPLQVESITWNNDSNSANLFWIAAPGRKVDVESSPDLINWSSLATNLAGNSYTDIITNPLNWNFYRLKAGTP